MTYSINTLKADSDARAPGGLFRFAQDFSLLLLAGVLLFWLLALFSHDLADPAWSTSGSVAHTRNWGGRLGAWFSDLNFYLFGLSAWWLLLAALHAWFKALRLALRGAAARRLGAEAQARVAWIRRIGRQLGLWCGLALLLASSCALEWAWLYRFDGLLPAGAGGAFGAQLGPEVMRWLGSTGSVLLGLPLWLGSSSQVFGFSWAGLTERLGQWLEYGFLGLRQRFAAGQDQRIGQQAARARDESASQARRTDPTQARVEPGSDPLAESGSGSGSQSGRFTASAQQMAGVRPDKQSADASSSRASAASPVAPRAFPDRAAFPLPSVDLLDPAPRQQSTVAPETLEMTSRLIEKKLGDFGVEVRVVDALPGPVITRYEIEPATGVKEIGRASCRERV